MAVTVGWLARQTTLGLSVVAGAGGLNREIRWAHAIELADPAPYLSGAELVMTTGIAVGRTRQAQHDYVARLLAADAAALAFDTGIRYQQVPPGIVDAADSLGLPVLQVPASTPFIAITRAVIDRINADQVKAVQRTVDEQERLARETLRGGVPAVVAALARALDATVVVISHDGRVLAGAGPEQDRVAAMTVKRRSSRSGVLADGASICTIQVLRAASTMRGHLAVRTDHAPDAAERLLISHSVSLIGIELEKPVRILDAEQRLRVAVTRGLLASPTLREPTLLRYFGIGPDDQVIVLLASHGGPDLPVQAGVHQVLNKTGVPFLMCPREDDIVIVVPASTRARIEAIHRALSGAIGSDVAVGVSKAGPLAAIPVLLSQAAAASRARARASLRWFDDIGQLDALLSGRSPEELAALRDPLAPLEGDPDLLATLTAFLDHNGQLEGAAAALQVHRHTLRHRMARINDALGTSLDSAETRAMLLIALHARALCELEPD